MIPNSDLLVGKNGKKNVIYIEKFFSSFLEKSNNECSNKEKEEYVRILETSFSYIGCHTNLTKNC